MHEHRSQMGCTIIGVGAAFEFNAGLIKRAPPVMQAMGLEWLSRLVQQPRRVGRRFLTTLPFFVLRLLPGLVRRPSRSRLQQNGSARVSLAGGRASEWKVLPAQGGRTPYLGLVGVVGREIRKMNLYGATPLLLNLGAGRSTGIEAQLDQAGARFVVDRVDLELTIVRHAKVRQQWAGTIEDLSAVADDSYDLIFCNYVLEHVSDVERAVGEMARVLQPGALAVLTVSNPRAPEFRVAARSPDWLHRVFQPNGFRTAYAYGSVEGLIRYLDSAGMWFLRSASSAPLLVPISRVSPDFLVDLVTLRPLRSCDFRLVA